VTFLRRWEGEIYGVMRILVGLLFAQHGLQKVFGLFGASPGEMPQTLRWSAGLIELVGGGLVALGLQTRIAAFICSGTMAVAYFTAHAHKHFVPVVNGGEMAILYCWIFLLIAARGGGRFSVDGKG
jgi:putative oxidoreductase